MVLHVTVLLVVTVILGVNASGAITPDDYINADSVEAGKVKPYGSANDGISVDATGHLDNTADTAVSYMLEAYPTAENYEVEDVPTVVLNGSGTLWQSTVRTVLASYDTDAGNYYNARVHVIVRGYSAIADSAFSGCGNLLSVTVESTVTTIGVSAFRSCTSMKSASIPDSVSYLGSFSFYNCSSLEDVSLGDGIQDIAESTFQSCTSLLRIKLPQELKTIGDLAFRNCSSIVTLNLPTSIVKVGNEAFKGCGTLSAIDLHNVVEIGESSFENCASMVTLNLGNSLESMGESSFSGCISIREVAIPSTLQSIPRWAFYGCKTITGVTFHQGLVDIGDEAFMDCSGLRNLVVPDTLKTLGNSSFKGNSSLVSVNFNEGLAAIGEGAFQDCISMYIAEIPSSVGSIGDFAFGAEQTKVYIMRVEKGNLDVGNLPVDRTFYYRKIDYDMGSSGIEMAGDLQWRGRDLTLPTVDVGGFLGWYFDGAYLNKVTSHTYTVTSEHVTFYAKWAEAPTEPLDLNWVVDVGSITITWNPPAFDGGSPIVGYEVSDDGGGTWYPAVGRHHVFYGTYDNNNYLLRVRAYNIMGAGEVASTLVEIGRTTLVEEMTLLGVVEPITTLDITVPLNGVLFEIDENRDIMFSTSEIISNCPAPIELVLVYCKPVKEVTGEGRIPAPELVPIDKFENWETLSVQDTVSNIYIKMNDAELNKAGTTIGFIGSAYNTQQSFPLVFEAKYGKHWGNPHTVQMDYEMVIEVSLL